MPVNILKDRRGLYPSTKKRNGARTAIFLFGIFLSILILAMFVFAVLKFAHEIDTTAYRIVAIFLTVILASNIVTKSLLYFMRY